MRFLTAVVCLGVAAATAGDPSGRADGQSSGLRREEWPDGTTRVEATVRPGPAGDVRHGPYARYHEDGGLAAEGAYSEGEPSGPWTTYWPGGAVRSRGEFLQGRRAGKWELFHPNGQLAGTGRYRLGLRDRKWVYLDAAGQKLGRDSGLYRSEGELYADRTRKFLVETVDGRWHGRLVAWWQDGPPLLDGSYREGRRDGDFTLWLADGSREPEFVTGRQAESPGSGPGASEPPAVPSEPSSVPPESFTLPEERARDDAPAPDPARLPRLPRAPGVDSRQRAAFEERIARFLLDPDERERRLAEELLLQYGREALPEVLNRLAELDLSEDAEHRAAEELARLLRRVCRGRGFAFAGEAQADRRTVARWFTWYLLVRDQDDWWRALHDGQLGSELLTLELVEGFLRPGPAAEPAEAEAGDGTIDPKLSMLFRRRRFETRSREVREPIERGLAWLALHRTPEGGWEAEDFGELCERAKRAVCDGAGEPQHDVGVASLALLAFLGDGNTIADGDHTEVVAQGLDWLLARQDPETGRFASDEEHGHSATYQHLLATLVLCEAASFTDSPAIRGPARRGLEVILAAQEPGAGWRYHFTSKDDTDTSVTAWAVRALHAGREVGLLEEAEVERAFAGARDWLDAVTEPATGRVGYYERGSTSARVQDVNDHYPVEGVEAMTAAATFARILMGADEEALAPQADLLLRSLPRRVPSEGRNDFYYWMHGTEAMAQLGGGHWKAWRSALLRALAPLQREDAEGSCVGGSWDPDGPWGYSGGRVFATALAVLSLQGDFRHPNWLR